VDLTSCVSRGTSYAFSYGGVFEDFPGRPKERPFFLKLTVERLKKIARRYPKEPLAHAWLGRALLDQGELAAAGRSLSSAAELDKRCFLALAWRGEALCRQNQFAPALADLDRAIGLNGLFVPAYLWRAVAQFSMGRREEASRDILRGTSCEPKDSEMIRAWARWALPRFAEAPKEVT